MIATLPEALVERARAAHETPGRAYHTFEHVGELLGWLERVSRDVGWQHPLEVTIAALFHDAIYVPGRADNETLSAELAREAVARFGPASADAERIAELISLTARHGRIAASEIDEEAALFLDADMAILGASPERFDAYDRGIAQEYGAIPPELFAAGRGRFFEGLLAAPRIFLSSYFHERLDAAARANIRRALSQP
jgi:predicted metal-dependent HD superfamily phosphohydrolase